MFVKGIKLRIMFRQIYFHCFYALSFAFEPFIYHIMYEDGMEKGQTRQSPAKNLLCLYRSDSQLKYHIFVINRKEAEKPEEESFALLRSTFFLQR